MTGHFIRRDLRDFLFWWVAMAAATVLVVACAIWFADPPVIVVLLPAYLMFALTAAPHLLGSWWRTQHQWSRHYLLALPLSHRRLFAIQHVRILIFWLPLTLLCAVAPAVPAPWWNRFGTMHWLLYYFGLSASINLMIEMQIWTTLDMERIVTYLPRNQRAWAWIRSMGVMLAVISGLWAAWTDVVFSALGVQQRGLFIAGPLFSWPGASIVIFPAAFLAAALWARHNARSWCVTL